MAPPKPRKAAREGLDEHERPHVQEEIGATSGKTHEQVLRDVVGPERARRAAEHERADHP